MTHSPLQKVVSKHADYSSITKKNGDPVTELGNLSYNQFKVK